MKKEIIVIRSKKGMNYAIDKYIHDDQNKRFKFVTLIDKKTNKKFNLDQIEQGEYLVVFTGYKDNDDNITLFGADILKEL